MQLDRARRHTRTLLIISRYKNGAPVEAICDEFEMSRSQILRIVRTAGCEKRPKHFPRKVKREVLRLGRKGIKLKTIADLCGVSVAYVSYALKEAGIPRYRKGLGE